MSCEIGWCSGGSSVTFRCLLLSRHPWDGTGALEQVKMHSGASRMSELESEWAPQTEEVNSRPPGTTSNKLVILEEINIQSKHYIYFASASLHWGICMRMSESGLVGRVSIWGLPKRMLKSVSTFRIKYELKCRCLCGKEEDGSDLAQSQWFPGGRRSASCRIDQIKGKGTWSAHTSLHLCRDIYLPQVYFPFPGRQTVLLYRL